MRSKETKFLGLMVSLSFWKIRQKIKSGKLLVDLLISSNFYIGKPRVDARSIDWYYGRGLRKHGIGVDGFSVVLEDSTKIIFGYSDRKLG